MLNLNRLRVLHEVATCRSLAGAAERLGHTPSAVSQQIAALESEVGARLVERHTRGVHLTEAGRMLADYGETILGDVRAAEQALAALADGKAGHLRLASFTTANAEFLPSAVSRFARTSPHITLALTEADPDESVALLANRDADVALVYEFPALLLPKAGLRLTELLTDRLHVALPRGHRLADRAVLTLPDLAGERWVQGAHRSSTSGILLHACRSAGFEPDIAFRIDDQMTVRGLVGAGLGVALASSLVLHTMPAGLVARPLSDDSLVRKVYAATASDAPEHPAAAAMIDCLRATG
ncbi:LysR family transcriptional regulator [Fodinicola acaciae]|uniref:LysR family transcriptional regulator n=1 Tax=Fodinicola acaciae TaxID=2681555 RepID=UPI0013CFFFE2|nr:LysR family transcriptional regulator [Fodinicola acaciae]